MKLRTIESHLGQGMPPEFEDKPRDQYLGVVDGSDRPGSRIFKVEQQLSLISHQTQGLMESQ